MKQLEVRLSVVGSYVKRLCVMQSKSIGCSLSDLSFCTLCSCKLFSPLILKLVWNMQMSVSGQTEEPGSFRER